MNYLYKTRGDNGDGSYLKTSEKIPTLAKSH